MLISFRIEFLTSNIIMFLNFIYFRVPPEGLPFGYGDGDRFPGHPG